ncbi:MAG TPA: NAD-dependent epimerase/dehydratase family protein, partial [Phycisphaerae bacterium]
MRILGGMAKTLILGGSGFVSGAMARAAVVRGDETYVVTRGVRRLPSCVKGLIADRNTPAFAEVMRRGDLPEFFDRVIDCIGFNADHARQDVETFFPLNAPARAGHLVFISTDWVCSPIDRPPEIDESFDRFDTVPYGGGKRAAEEVFLAAVGERGREKVPVTILRPCHIYGPGSLLGCVPLHGRDAGLLERIRGREILRLLGRGHFLQQPIFVEDLVAMA